MNQNKCYLTHKKLIRTAVDPYLRTNANAAMCLAQWSYRKPPDKKVQWLEVMYKMGTSHFRAVSEECLELLGITILTCSRLSVAGEKRGRAREKLKGPAQRYRQDRNYREPGTGHKVKIFQFF